ncbi:MAG: hypothetical protein C1943_06915 [Halochromatium sp.]|nr:hypothetical protein [Halochromatium sp.]
MAISESKRQKKLQQKKKKRQLAGRATSKARFMQPSMASHYAHLPIHECLAPTILFEMGIGSLIWARRSQEGQIAVSAFVVDVFCLGVKNAMFHFMEEDRYEHEMKPALSQSQGQWERLHPSCARKLIEGAADYAADLGFSAHRDYRNARGIFGDVDASACPTRFDYGSDGQPFYIQGPNESTSQANQIIKQLTRRCGEGQFHYTMML